MSATLTYEELLTLSAIECLTAGTFRPVGSGYGYGDGSGSGSGSGSGYGDGYGSGSGNGSGYGDGSGSVRLIREGRRP